MNVSIVVGDRADGYPSPTRRFVARQGMLVTFLGRFLLRLTECYQFPPLALLHLRGEPELSQNVVFKHQDNFACRSLENGSSRDCIQACKHVSVKLTCARRSPQNENTSYL